MLLAHRRWAGCSRHCQKLLLLVEATGGSPRCPRCPTLCPPATASTAAPPPLSRLPLAVGTPGAVGMGGHGAWPWACVTPWHAAAWSSVRQDDDSSGLRSAVEAAGPCPSSSPPAGRVAVAVRPPHHAKEYYACACSSLCCCIFCGLEVRVQQSTGEGFVV